MAKKKINVKQATVKALLANENQDREKFQNGLWQATLGNGPFNLGLGYGNGTGIAAQPLSGLTTLQNNLRYAMVTNLRTDLSWAFVEIGLIQTICCLPVDDGLRGGVEVKTKQLEPEEIEELIAFSEDEGDLIVANHSAVWERLYGGSGIIIVTDADPINPFDIREIKKGGKLGFKAADLWELFWAQQFAQDGQDIFGINSYDSKTFMYYGLEIDKTRVMSMKGIMVPSFLRPTLRGWGVSVVETLIRGINQYLKSNDLIFEVLDEFKLDIFKLKNLANTLLQKDGTQKIQARVQLMNLQKNYNNAMVMDADDDHINKELSFSGISETMAGIRMQIASDMKIPLSKLFGTGATGLGSGEDDIENYNAMIESSVRSKLKRPLTKIMKLRCQQLFGFVPDDLSISFKPLRILSAVDEQTVKNAEHSRLLATRTAGECTTEEFKEGCNSADLLPIQLDTSIPTIDMNPVDETGETPKEKLGTTKPKQPSAEKSSQKSPETPKVKNKLYMEFYDNDQDKEKFANPGNVDESKWRLAKHKCVKEYGYLKWPVVTDIYEKMGGTF